MASKRKSTVPCMIPSKSKHVREEIILGSLPELLPTIPEDSILSISGEESRHSSQKSESGNETQKGGTYSCPACRFESRDLNYFLDHMHNCHLDFRAQPTFYCLNCGMSVVRFEALALHNANTHPKIMEGLVTASLTVNKRDGITTVEQSLFTDTGEDKESAIPLTKTPIAKMMKAKGEHKKIVVSHTVEVRKIDLGKEIDPSMMTNVPELQNGAPSVSGASAMPRTTVSHEVTTATVSNPVFHQHTPSLYSPPSSDFNKDLPKVMIPLSSIPTYDAAMDTSSFLKTSFGKFPYPTKAELCYLTVVSEFPEEQIKLWFTAQRLKQGISWSPEEIEEARRKMFNTVFQGRAPQKQPAAPRQVNHIVTHHTVHPSSKGPNFPMAKVPYSIMKTRPAGVISKQVNMSTNPNVTRVSYSTQVMPPRLPSAVRIPQALTRNTQATVEPDKSNGLGLELPVGSGGISSSSSRSSSCSSSICNGETINSKLVNNSPTNSSANISNNDEHCVTEINGKPNIKSTSPTGLEGQNGTNKQVIINNTSKPTPTCNSNSSSISPQEEARNSKSNNNTHMNTNNSVNSEHPRTTCIDGVPSLNHASKSPTEITSTTVITMNNSSISDENKPNKDFSIKGMSILQQLIKDEDPLTGDRNGPELKINPIKINFKRMKMNEPNNTPESIHQDHRSEVAEMSTPQSSFSPPWSNKTPQQLHILRQVFSSTRWPSSQQYEELSVQTGLPKSEVVRWFSDSRYSHKNGQLKWLETYQRLPADPEAHRGHGDTEAELQKDLLDKKKLAEQDMIKHLEGEGLGSGQQMVWQDTYPPLLGLMGSKEIRGGPSEAAPVGVLKGPWSESAEDHQQTVANQSLIEQQTDTNQARDRLRMELLEV